MFRVTDNGAHFTKRAEGGSSGRMIGAPGPTVSLGGLPAAFAYLVPNGRPEAPARGQIMDGQVGFDALLHMLSAIRIEGRLSPLS